MLLLPVQFSNVVHGIARFWYPHGSAQQTDKCVRRIVLCARPDSFGAGAIDTSSSSAKPGCHASSNTTTSLCDAANDYSAKNFNRGRA